MISTENKNIIIHELTLPHINKKINIEFERGFNYLRGENGCGKTLLLDYISGLRKQKNALIQGNESILYINQSIFFSDRLLGRDFLQFFYQLDCVKHGKLVFEHYVTSFYGESEESQILFQLMEKQWGMLSSGEKNFLYTIILLSLQREWYILDEPFTFIDENRKKLLWDMIKAKVYAGHGIILTSHEEQKWIEEKAFIIEFTKTRVKRCN